MDYRDGATLIETRSQDWGAFALGNYVLAQEGTTVRDPLFKHEYGHYIQSQKLGPLYFPLIALPSLGNSAGWWGADDHHEFWTETWADEESEEPFGRTSYTHECFVNGTCPISKTVAAPNTAFLRLQSGKGHSETDYRNGNIYEKQKKSESSKDKIASDSFKSQAFRILLLTLCLTQIGCWFHPDGEYDNKLKAKNESSSYMLIAVSRGCKDSTITGPRFGVPPDKEKSLSMPGKDFWEKVLIEEGCLWVTWIETSDDEMTLSQMKPLIRKERAYYREHLDSLNWVLMYP